MSKRGPAGQWGELQGNRLVRTNSQGSRRSTLDDYSSIKWPYKKDTKQAYLYGDMGDDVVYLRPTDWWPEPIPEGHALLLVKNIYGTKQAAWKWHTHILDWMIRNGYLAVNSEKTIF